VCVDIDNACVNGCVRGGALCCIYQAASLRGAAAGGMLPLSQQMGGKLQQVPIQPCT
jgi:hypothetical protein